jgi:peptidoglycan biosynthesis protein MviN/MurJ (putative lipid II flippase)
MWLPVLVGTVATVVAIPLSLVMFDAAGVEGLAIASTLVMWLYTIALALIWGHRRSDRWRPLATTVVRSLPLALVAALLIRVLNASLAPSGALGALLMAVVSLAVLVTVLVLGGRLLRLEESRWGWWRRANEREADPDAPA